MKRVDIILQKNLLKCSKNRISEIKTENVPSLSGMKKHIQTNGYKLKCVMIFVYDDKIGSDYFLKQMLFLINCIYKYKCIDIFAFSDVK